MSNKIEFPSLTKAEVKRIQSAIKKLEDGVVRGVCVLLSSGNSKVNVEYKFQCLYKAAWNIPAYWLNDIKNQFGKNQIGLYSSKRSTARRIRALQAMLDEDKEAVKAIRRHVKKWK